MKTTHAAAGSPRENLEESRRAFEQANPEFGATRSLDELRQRDYGRLDALGHVYLDYTGGSLYGESQVRKHMDLLLHGVFGNPHSSNPTSLAMTELVEKARRHVLDFFNASPEEYLVIFTSNTTGALKLVGESYPFAAGGQFLLTYDNHNSVNGIREFARQAGSKTTYVPVLPPEMRVPEEELRRRLDGARPGAHNLFAFPAQSNFSGVQHPLDWIHEAQAKGWDVLLDAAAFVPSNRLDLGRFRPEFLTMSFYKMFGYPTGVGALIGKREAMSKLRRPWFAGGTITVVSVQADRYFLAEGASAFEDGTLNYLMLPAVDIGLDHLESIGMDRIHQRVQSVTAWLLGSLLSLRHANGEPLIRMYGPPVTERRGGTVTMNFYDSRGQVVDHRQIENLANQHRISLRTGCFCNPGAGEMALGLSGEELSACFSDRSALTLDDFRMCIDGKGTGAVRVSTGVATNFDDVYRFVELARSLLDEGAAR
jgi:selenocysteine lyase/cysteine desulfurase